MPTTILDTSTITDWISFHAACKVAFGFPDFYGANMNAWIDCLSYLGEGDGLSRFHLSPGEMLTIEIRGAEDFVTRCPEQALALMTATAAINQRCEADGKPPMLLLLPV